MKTYIQVTIVSSNGSSVTTQLQKGMSLKEALNNTGIQQPAFCGGSGICGKCIVKYISEPTKPNYEDISFIQPKDLLAGHRLACQSYPTDDAIIEVLSEEVSGEFQVVTDVDMKTEMVNTFSSIKKEIMKKDTSIKAKEEKIDFLDIQIDQEETAKQAPRKEKNQYAIAIDLGTTSIVFKLVNVHLQAEVLTYAILNSQRSIGADVVSRIAAANNGKGNQLCQMIRTDLSRGIEHLTAKAGIPHESINKICISGNTTMVHLLMEYPCDELGKEPYKAYSLNMISVKCHEILYLNWKTDMVILPAVSAFVGGDILSGSAYVNMADSYEMNLFVDIGTNTEMVLGNNERVLCTSAAAGPALEGGHLECGVGSILGAIAHVEIDEHLQVHYTTIGGKKPIGICGSGVIDIIAEGFRRGIIDKNGLMRGDYFEKGIVLSGEGHNKPIYLSQSDIREIQLAKGAIRAGIEVLIDACDIHSYEIKNVFLAGGFGAHINIENAMEIGLLPKSFSGKVKVLGNTSLGGAAHFLTEKGFGMKMLKIRGIAKSINLAKNDKFNEYFIQYLNL